MRSLNDLHSQPHTARGIASLLRRRWVLATSLVVLLFALGIVYNSVAPFARRLRFRSDLSWYDLGAQGLGPSRSYRSYPHTFSDVEWLRWDARCSQDYIFIAPRGSAVEPGATILDYTGEPVWKLTQFEGNATQDFRVQEYQGEQVLTFWVGTEGGGHKLGRWYMMDDTYTVKKEVNPGGNDFAYGDMHEFLITEDDTALITIYDTIPYDLSPLGGRKDGYLLDCLFQEINLESGEVLFQWRASDHFPLDHTHRTIDPCTDNPVKAYMGCGNTPDAPFDWYHINSIDKDDRGNYLVSGRNLHVVSYVDGRTGAVKWNLGGRSNNFTDTTTTKSVDGTGPATFMWQHDARWHDNYTALTLFDNARHHFLDPYDESRGLLLDVDLATLSVSLRREYRVPEKWYSHSQGNLQYMPDSGHAQVCWGFNPGFTEFGQDGEVLCDAHFGPFTFSDYGAVTTYRLFRGRWVGRPGTKPDVVVQDGSLYVSWNGATEVERWRIVTPGSTDGNGEKADDRDNDHDDDDDEAGGKAEAEGILSEVFKSGFETEILLGTLPQLDGQGDITIQGVAANGTVLGTSEPVDWSVSQTKRRLRPITSLVFGALALLLLVAAVVISAVAKCRSRRDGSGEKERGEYELLAGRGAVGGPEEGYEDRDSSERLRQDEGGDDQASFR